MNLGLFIMPLAEPGTPLYDVNEMCLEMIRYADELGYEEAWVGEHYTAVWEPVPSPDIIIAQALKQTKKIKLAAGAHLLPYHHPVELAHRVAYMDHIAQGRLMLGIAAGALSTDREMFGLDPTSGEQYEMTNEAMEIMLKLWTEEKFEYKGKYWSAKTPEPAMGGNYRMHIKPFQKPYPPIGVAGSSGNSNTLKLAGKYGFIPMSLCVTEKTAASHWNCIVEGAVESGKTPKRDEWRIVHHVLVADTDEEALDLALNGMMGRAFAEHYLPTFSRKSEVISQFKHDKSIPDKDVTVEYLSKHYWLIGSPETVAKKLDVLYEGSGGFGTLLVTAYDYGKKKDVWFKSMRLLKEEVLPRLKHKLTVS